MTTPSSGGGGFEDREAGLGGADAVPDTPDVAGHGTEPNQPAPGRVRGEIKSSGGLAPAAWLVIIVIALVVLLLYGGGLFAA